MVSGKWRRVLNAEITNYHLLITAQCLNQGHDNL